MPTDTPDILADYRQWAAAQPERISTHSDRCHLWSRHERCMIHRLAAALQRTRDEQVSATRHTESAAAAWLVSAADGSGSSTVCLLREEAEAVAAEFHWCLAPLYSRPHCTLTDAEREAVETAALEAEAHQHMERAATLRGLLERTK